MQDPLKFTLNNIFSMISILYLFYKKMLNLFISC